MRKSTRPGHSSASVRPSMLRDETRPARTAIRAGRPIEHTLRHGWPVPVIPGGDVRKPQIPDYVPAEWTYVDTRPPMPRRTRIVRRVLLAVEVVCIAAGLLIGTAVLLGPPGAPAGKSPAAVVTPTTYGPPPAVHR